MKIILEFEMPEGTDEHEMRLTMLDSFYEFIGHRGPTAKTYVERRYPVESFSVNFQQDKIKQVNRRIEIANALHKAAFDLKIE